MQTRFELAYYNDKWNLHIKTEFSTEISEGNLIIESSQPGFVARLLSHNIKELPHFNLFKFGILTDDVSKRPGNGGMWSSRSGIINPLLHVSLLEIAFNGWACAIDKQDLEEICPEIKCERQVDSKGEETYEIKLPHDPTITPHVVFTHNL